MNSGDKIVLDVYAKSNLTDGFDPVALTSGIVSAITGNVNDMVVGIEGSGLTNGVIDIFDNGLMAVTSNTNSPKAYLQYVLLDESFGYVSSDAVPVVPGDDWQQLVLEDKVVQDGYLYAYVVNESNINVFFDDFTVQVLGTRAIRKTDYYPFGAVAKQWNNPDQTQQEKYRHGYQGEYSEADSTTGWNAFQLRMYDPIIGRWLQVDPERQHNSPYLSMGNNPLTRTDPDGGTDYDGYKDQNGNILWIEGETRQSFVAENGQEWTKVTDNRDNWNAMLFGDLTLDQVELFYDAMQEVKAMGDYMRNRNGDPELPSIEEIMEQEWVMKTYEVVNPESRLGKASMAGFVGGVSGVIFTGGAIGAAKGGNFIFTRKEAIGVIIGGVMLGTHAALHAWNTYEPSTLNQNSQIGPSTNPTSPIQIK